MFDERLPRTAAGSQEYDDREWDVLQDYLDGFHSPDEHPCIRGKYRPLVPFDEWFGSSGITSQRVHGDFDFRPEEVLLGTAAAKSRLFNINMHQRVWPRQLPKFPVPTVHV